MMDQKIEYLLHRLVTETARAADKILSENLKISYNRHQVLVIIQHYGTLTQHALAVTLGHSDPAVSKMLAELSKEGFVNIKIDPKHARKRLVTLTPKGKIFPAREQCYLTTILTR